MEDESSSSTTAEDTAAATPDSANAPDTSTSTPDSGNGGAPAPAGNQTPPSNGTPGTPPAPGGAPEHTGQPPANAPAQPMDWQKRYTDLQSATDRRLNQAKLEMQRTNAETAELRAFRQQQMELAQRQNLRPWQKQHPENQKFAGLRERAKTIDAQLKNLPTTYPDGTPIPPEHLAQTRQAIMSTISEPERQQLTQYRDEIQQFQHSFFEDPRGTLAPMLREVIAQEMRTAQEQAHAEHQVAQDFETPEFKEFISTHGPEVRQALEEGVPYKYVMHMSNMFRELEQLRANVPTLTRKATMAEEQQRLAKGRASVTHDPAPAKNVDIYALAKAEAAKQGITPGSPLFNKIYDKLEAANRSP